ncbi:MAG: Na/Pi cotransporter family protein [Sedimentisphaerales bacterium]
MDAKIITEMIFAIVGGLGIFLLGMKNISEGMQAVAGEKLRKLINAVTNNRFVACGIGALVTSIIQSSSVTTVIAVGMVNAGIMTLTQSIGIIYGANIGTTITAWILVVDIAEYGLPLMGIAAMIYLFVKNEKVSYSAMAAMGLGMVFFGLVLMKNGFAPLKEMPGFIAWFSRFSPDSYIGVIKCVLVGSVLTAIIQSSSATVGITMGLALNGIIDYPTAAALVLGQNVGTTVTALLASVGTSTNARRTAWAHTLFNILGVLWITTIFFPYIKFIQTFVHWHSGSTVGTAVMADSISTFPHTLEAIALTHTFFNLFNAILFLPFIKQLASLLNYIVPEKAIPEKPRLTALDIRMFDAPALGIEQSRREVLVMSQAVMEMMNTLKEVILSPDEQKVKTEQLFEKEREMDLMQKEIVEFISATMTGNIPHDVADESRRQLRIADELESISDYITNILKLNLKLRQSGQKMSPKGLEAMIDLHNNAAEYIAIINEAAENNDENILTPAESRGQSITELMKRYRREHIARVSSGEATPVKSLIYTDMLNAYRRIKDHGLNIAEVLSGEK